MIDWSHILALPMHASFDGAVDLTDPCEVEQLLASPDLVAGWIRSAAQEPEAVSSTACLIIAGCNSAPW